MSDKEKEIIDTESAPVGRLNDIDISKEMNDSFLKYSMSVIVSRALPDIRDGLKPVHRRILYTMFENGLHHNQAYRKCADTVGSVLGKYHPHGDTSVYDAMVRLAQDFSMRYPLVDGHGNFGSVDGDPPAAYRYTESRMTRLTEMMMQDIDKETVDFTPNYDDRLQEPTALPCHFPNLLVNGSIGIAVGMTTNIPPHNMSEVVDGVCAYIDNPDITLDEIMEHIKGPDFPTAGIIMGRAGIRATYATGKGKITVRARTEIVEEKGRYKIVVTELPYQVNKARLHENIAELVKDKRIEGISNVEDHSDRNGMYLVIDVKKDASPQIVLNQLFRYTQMQVNFSSNMLAIVRGEPKTLTLMDILREYADFHRDIVRRRVSFDLKKAQERAHILEGLKIALDFIDEVIALLRASKSVSEGKEALMERFTLDEIQANAIVQMPLGRLTGLERQKIEDELNELHEKIEDYIDILGSEIRVNAIVKEEITNIKNKYNDDRRTEIVTVTGEVDIEDLIPEEECLLTLTNFGYIKRTAADTYKVQGRGGRGVNGMKRRDEDFAKEMFLINSHDYVMLFTNRGRVYRIKCYEIPEGSRTSQGMNIANLIPIESGESVTTMIKVPEIEEDMYLTMATRNGIIKRNRLSDYKNIRKGGLICINLDEGDELGWVCMTDGTKNIIAATRNGKAMRFNENDVRCMGRTAHGVKLMNLKNDDCIVGVVTEEDGRNILTVSEQGFGRISIADEYRLQSRGGMGVTNYHTDKYGKVAAVKTVREDEDIIIITENGIIIRIEASSIRPTSRTGKGVKVMRVSEDGGMIASVAIVEHEEEEASEENPNAETEKESENGEE